MIKVVPFNPVHLKYLTLQDAQAADLETLGTPEYQELLLRGESFTLINNGDVIMCCGVFPLTASAGRAWALVDKDAGRGLIVASRKISAFFKKSKYARIDTTVERGFVNGQRWCKLIGFINETPNGMKHYGDAGETYDLYGLYTAEMR